MESFFENEIENNALLLHIKNDPNLLSLLNKEKGSIFLPQNASLATITITTEVARAHIFISNPKDRSQFISLGGVHGVFKNDRQLIHVIARPLPNQHFQFSQSLFLEAQPLFKASKIKNPNPVIVLRETSRPLAKSNVSIVLVSEPIFIGSSTKDGDEEALIPNLPARVEPAPRTRPPLSESQSLPAAYVTGQLSSLKDGSISDSEGSRNNNTNDNNSSSKRRHSIGDQKTQQQPPHPTKQSAQFLQLINRPEAKEIANAIRKFVQKFLQSPPSASKHGQVVRNFLDITEKQISIHPLWKDNRGGDPESTQEALEKLVTSKLFKQIFCPTEEDEEKDKELASKMAKLNRFLQPKHLDIKPNFIKQEFLTRAIAELCKINDFKSPRDKMVCIMNCCKVIYKMLNSITASSNMEAAGADDFLPMLIYVLIRSKVPNVHSNTQYIRRFRHPSKLMTETGYYFTHFESTLHFISTADHERFSLEKEVWDKYMYGNSVDFTLIQDADELRVGDVPDLLTAYQHLHEENARLKKEIEDLKASVRRRDSSQLGVVGGELTRGTSVGPVSSLSAFSSSPVAGGSLL